MNIDRAAFLAITASLAVGCAASSSGGDEAVATGDDAEVISAGGGKYCYAADESTDGYAKEYWIGQIGFDPVNDFPAAEGFCFDAAATGKNDKDGFPEFNSYIYRKCNAYAKTYVPHVQYTSYATLKEKIRAGMTDFEKWDVLYALDQEIAAEDFFCQKAVDRRVCRDASDKAACLRASTQLVPAAKERLGSCMQSWDVYTCIEGAHANLRPGGGF
ncbi:MAG: hypothetical protein KIT84_36610 [Labilithrix sp.]|nr:hypothetical protein [Labilithrix sp.]MCW5816579.1 hypothetical protein [Labilithrix sp.]